MLSYCTGIVLKLDSNIRVGSSMATDQIETLIGIAPACVLQVPENITGTSMVSILISY